MDKAKTLPRTKRDKSPSPSSSSFSSLKSSFRGLKKNTPLMGKKKKKKATDTPPASENAPLNETPELPETPIGPPEASSTPSVDVDAVKPTQPMLKTPKKAKPPIKKIVKGGKGFLHKFKGKNESAPIMVDATMDVRRSAPKKDDENEKENADIAEELENGDISAEMTVTSKDEWSTTATCEKVRKLSRLEIHQSVYSEEVDGEGEGEGLPDPSTPEDETFGEDESKVKSASEPDITVNGHTQPPISIDKKSPSTIKKEILSAVNSAKIRKTSDPISNGSRSNKPRKVSMQARSPSDKNEFLFKILVIGELGTGKTSIIKRYVHQFFSQHYRATIGVDFALKVLPWDSETTIRLQLWDIAGQERFGSMTRVYYKEAVGAFIVFDVTRESTFEAVTKWKQDLDAKVQLGEGEPIPCVLLANKCDQPKEGLVNNNNKMNEFCKENQFVAWFETSAKDNINIEEAANCLVAKIVQNNQKKQQEKEATNGTGVISIDNVDGNAPIKRKFCNAC